MIKHSAKFFSAILSTALFLLALTGLNTTLNAQIIESEMVITAKDSTNSLFLDGMQDIMLEKNEEAFLKFTKVVQAQPKHATAHYQLSRLWMAKGNLAKAIEEIKLAEKYDPDNKWILDFYANLMASAEDYTKAAALYSRLAKAENDPEDYLYKEAVSYRMAGKFKESIAVLDIIQSNSGQFDADLEVQRAQTFFQFKQYDSAIAIGKRLVAFDPKQSAYALFLIGTYFKMDNEQLGFQELKKADKKFPENSSVQSLLYLYYEKNSNVIGRTYLNEILLERKQPMDTKLATLLALANLSISEAKLEKIYGEYLPILAAQDSANQDAYLFYGIYLQSMKKPDSALVQYKRVIDVDSGNNEAWQRIMSLYTKKETADSLIVYSNKGIALFPENPIYNYYKGLAYVFKEEPKNAVATLEDGLSKTEPKDSIFVVTFHSMLGDTYQQTKEFDKADSSYKIAFQYDSTDVGLLNNYSYYLSVQNKRLEEAERMSAYTIKMQPQQASFLDTYGWILYQQGKYKEAKKYIKRAIKYNEEEGSGVMLEHLGDIEYKLGNNKAALKYWMQAQEKGVDTPELLEKINTKKLND